MQVEALEARQGAIPVSPCSGAPARRLARLPIPQLASLRTPWLTVSTPQRAGDGGGAARLDRHGSPPLPSAAGAASAAQLVLEITEPDFDTCAALGHVSLGGAKARPGDGSPTGALPGPTSSGVLPGPKARATAALATPAVRVSLPGTRARNEQRGRSIQRLRSSHPRVWAARACSSPSSQRSARVAA